LILYWRCQQICQQRVVKELEKFSLI